MRNKSSGVIRWLLLLGLPAVFLAFAGCHPAQPVENLPIKIGSPGGAGGLLAAYAAAKMEVKTEVTQLLELTPIQDCCSSYAQWALSSRSVDAAVICIDAARFLVEKDSRYSILGPCLANSDLVVVHDPEKVQTVGIVQNHQYQKEIAHRVLGKSFQVKPMLPTALSYAYTRGDVDGVVMDIEEALRLEGSRIKVNSEERDVVTYVLVTSREFQASPGFAGFRAVFRKASAELNSADNLQQAINKYSQYPVTGKEAGQWIQIGIRFMAPD